MSNFVAEAAVTPLPGGGGGLPTEARIENQGGDGTRGRIGDAVGGIRTRGIRSSHIIRSRLAGVVLVIGAALLYYAFSPLALTSTPRRVGT